MKKYSTFDRTFWFSISVFLIIVIIILFLPYLLTSRSWFGLDFSNTGQIGDTIGGIIGPFIAIIAAGLTFIAFWVQYTFNRQQWQSIQIDRLENRIYEMLNLHRQNVQELKYRNNKGRNAFNYLFLDLKYTYLLLEIFSNNYPELEELKNKEKLSSVAYLIFFIGIDENNNDYLENLIKKQFIDFPFFDLVNSFLLYKDQDLFATTFNLNKEQLKTGITSLQLNNKSQILGHYFRHLYQMVKYIDSYSKNILTKDDKYQYVRTIRAQLSNYEQLLLYYNSLSPFGNPWLKEGYLVRYKMIKNIPLPLANFGITPQQKFEKEIAEAKSKREDFFEWSE